MSEDEHRFKREVLAVATLLSLGSLLILLPFLDALLFAVATSYLLRYLHDWIDSHIEHEIVSTAIIVTGILGLVSLGLYAFVSNFGEILRGINSVQGSVNSTVVELVELLGLSERFSQQILQFVETVTQGLRSEIIRLFAEIPSVMVHLAVFSVASIYLYKDGERIEQIVGQLIESLPDEEKRIAESLVDSVRYVFHGVFVTQVLVALSMGAIAWIGFYLIGLITSPMPLAPLYAGVIVVTALLPLVANFMVYGPIGVYQLIAGDPLKGGLILVFGITILQALPEIFLRPYIGSWRMNEHPLIIFMGFLLGPLTLGLKGLILGPLILILTKEFILDCSRLFS